MSSAQVLELQAVSRFETWRAAFAIWLDRCRASGMSDAMASAWWDDPRQPRFGAQTLNAMKTGFLMRQRGRKSASSLEVAAPVQLSARPKAPDHLSEAEAAIWGDLTAAMRSDYFTRSDHDVLANACRHLASVREISRWLRKAMAEDETGIGDVDQLLKMRQRETAAANSCLRALRLTKQAQLHQRTAANASAEHLWGGGDEPRKPWERA